MFKLPLELTKQIGETVNGIGVGGLGAEVGLKAAATISLQH